MTDITNKPLINERTYTEPIDNRSRINGVTLLITQIGVMVGYGLSGSFRNDAAGIEVLRSDIILLILMFLFVLAGFGMLLNIYRFGNWLGTSTALVLLAVTIQLGPLLQKLFISIILTGFGSVNQSVTGVPVAAFWTAVTNTKIDSGVYLIRTALLSVISGMVVMSATVGRVGILQIVKFSSLYQIFWVINYFLLIYMNVVHNVHNATPYNSYFFDMFGTTYVYLFAVFFGIPFSCLLKRQALPEVHPRNQFNRLSLTLSQIGTGFIIALFVFTSCYVINYNFYANATGNNVARFSIFFGIIGSIIGTFVGSALVGQGRVGYKEVLTGTITGAIVMGAAAPLITNIGIIIMIGSVTGFLCGIYMRVLHVKINKNNVKDVLGLFGPFCIASIIGSLIVVPSIISVYNTRNIAFPFTDVVPPFEYAGYQLIYVGLSAGIGLVGGLLTSIFSTCDKDYFALASNSRIYLNEFGLYDLGEASKSQQVLPPPGVALNPLETPGLQLESQHVLNRTGALI